MGSDANLSIDPAAAINKPERLRLEWLDGVRGCAALFVVLHHTYISVFPGFPINNGPAGLGFLMFGHLAVVVFIVVSGFSLGLAPTRRRNDLKHGSLTFYHRRAWRILPPYWVALILALISHWFLMRAAGCAAGRAPSDPAIPLRLRCSLARRDLRAESKWRVLVHRGRSPYLHLLSPDDRGEPEIFHKGDGRLRRSDSGRGAPPGKHRPALR